MLVDAVEGALLLSSQDRDLVVHRSDVLLLDGKILSLLILNKSVLLSHLVKLIHATLVEVDMLLDVNFISIHDISETVGDLVGEVLFGLLILFWHQASVELSILFIQKFAALLDLGEISHVWLLVLANVTFHDVPNLNETLMRIFFDGKDIEVLLVTSGHISLKGCPGSPLSHSLKVSLVGVEFGSKDHGALISQAVDLISQPKFDLLLLSDLLSESVVLVVTLVDELVEFLFELIGSLLAQFKLEVVGLKPLILKLRDELLRLVLLLKANDFAFELRVFFDEDLDVGAKLVHFKLKVRSQARNLSSEISQRVDTLRLLALEDI